MLTINRECLLMTIEFLNDLADKLDAWAQESRSGGWSTHQVEANKREANECRREAARLRAMAKKAP